MKELGQDVAGLSRRAWYFITNDRGPGRRIHLS